MVFREGILPHWEHSANSNGGHFQVNLKPEIGGTTADTLWRNVVFSTVSGLIEPADMVCGVRLVDIMHKAKPSVRIEFWFSDMDEGNTGRLFDLKRSFES